MLFANCPMCGYQAQYVPEQTGLTGMCPGCSADVVFQQAPRQIARTIAGVVVAVLSFAALGFFGLIGGIVALASHGVVIVIVVVVAVVFGMKIRDVLLILALYLGVMVVANLEWRSNVRKKKADGAVASPLFANLSREMTLSGPGRSPL